MFKKLFVVILLPLLACLAGCATNPVTGEEQLQLFGSGYEQDIKIGASAAPEVEEQFGGKIENSRLQNYINSVGQSIARVSHASEIEFHFAALKDDTVNAFALPGGWVYITKGMLEKLESEAQLAGILGHESAHITARHTTAQMSKQIGLQAALAAALSQTNSSGVAQAADLGAQFVSLKFSRDDEAQADLIGLDYMVDAGYNPYGMVETMEMLEEESKMRPIEFLSTHPNPENRILRLRAKIELDGYSASELKTGEADYRKYVLSNLGD